MNLTKRHAALRAARGLFGRLFRDEFRIDFVKVVRACLGSPLLGHAAAQVDEFEHSLDHEG